VERVESSKNFGVEELEANGRQGKSFLARRDGTFARCGKVPNLPCGVERCKHIRLQFLLKSSVPNPP